MCEKAHNRKGEGDLESVRILFTADRLANTIRNADDEVSGV
jgi:hypothetical protein